MRGVRRRLRVGGETITLRPWDDGWLVMRICSRWREHPVEVPLTSEAALKLRDMLTSADIDRRKSA